MASYSSGHQSSVSAGFTLRLSRVPKRFIRPTFSTGQKYYGQVQLQGADEYAYLVPLSIGDQFFQAIFDTGSSDLWIVSSACTSVDCQRVRKYNPTPTLAPANASFQLTYLTGAVSGSIAYETVVFGPYVVYSQVLALANSTTNMGLATTRVSGVLGLAFPKEAAIPMTVGHTLLDNIFASIDSSERLLAFKLDADEYSSSFSVGQIDLRYADRLSEISYSPVFASKGAEYDYWKLPLLALSLNSVPVPFALSSSKVRDSSSPIAVLDTGTTLILGPSHDVDNFWTIAGGTRKGEDGMWQVRCEHAVTVGFLLGNDSSRKEIILDPSDVSWMPAGSRSEDGWCLGGIQSNDGVRVFFHQMDSHWIVLRCFVFDSSLDAFKVFSGDWLLGDIFLRNAYVVHRAETSTSPPLIGLLGTTNTSATFEQFQMIRGNDSSGSAFHAQLPYHTTNPPSLGVIFATTLISSFLGGVGLGVLFRFCREKRKKNVILKAVHTH